ncbi:MAG: sensor histidine kinase [Saccharofermentanales bacterium]
MISINSRVNKIKNFADEIFASEIKVMYVYRYLSLLLISLIYLINGSRNAVYYEFAVIAIFFILAKYITDLYVRYMENRKIMILLVLFETFSVEALLLSSGGLSSPFIWYATNVTFVAASYLSVRFSWINLVLFLCTGFFINYWLYNIDDLGIIELLTRFSNIIIVFILLNLVVQLLSNITKKLHKSNIEKEESIRYLMDLYQFIEALNNHSCKDELFDVLMTYTSKLTKSDSCMLWLKENNVVRKCKNISDEEAMIFLAEMKKDLDVNRLYEIKLISVDEKNILMIPILSSFEFYGIIAVNFDNNPKKYELEKDRKLLKFISDLCTVTLERFNLEVIEGNLLILQEQNRIADEMHDSVSQRIFSVVYGIHGVLGRVDTISKDELTEYLSELKKSASIAMNELKNSIYRLSSKKNGDRYFIDIIQLFLNSISKLYEIETIFNIDGDEKLLPFNYKNGLIRIIKEACGNSIRHGKCRNITINLSVHDGAVNLSIKDDGIGFILENVRNNAGLGLINMRSLVSSYNGVYEIKSDIGAGTLISIILPSIQLTGG